MDAESRITPTCSALEEIGIVVFESFTGFKNDSMGGRYLSLLSTNATNLVLSGTKNVLVLLAYWSLRDAKRFLKIGH